MSQVGRHIGTTYQQVRKYETGENRMSAATVFRLSQLLGVEIGEFFRDVQRSDSASPTQQAAGVRPAAESEFLDRIEDREVRRHLAGLLEALGTRR